MDALVENDIWIKVSSRLHHQPAASGRQRILRCLEHGGLIGNTRIVEAGEVRHVHGITQAPLDGAQLTAARLSEPKITLQNLGPLSGRGIVDLNIVCRVVCQRQRW